jgi:transcriptional regulator with XRE-family HTH domain
MKKKLNHLVSIRRRWGFTQLELAELLGFRGSAVVSLLESGERMPSLVIAFSYEVIFRVPAAELFPGLFDGVEEEVLTRAYELFERLQGDPSKITRAKLDLLQEALDQVNPRNRRTSV